jgi:SAM-dependent methyltransferase
MTEPRYRRASVVRVVDAAERMLVLEPGGKTHVLEGPSAGLARALLAFLLAPRSRDEVIAHVAELTGAPVEDATVIDQLLALLTGAQAVTTAAPKTRARPLAGTRIVVGLTGAIAVTHAPALITQLQARGAEIRAAATVSAQRFVSVEALEALLHARVHVDLHDGTPDEPVPHIALARWADLVLLWPAAASTLSRLVAGDFGSIVSAVALSASCPVMVVPSMNAGMYAGPAVQRNVAQLRSDGMHVVQPAFGVEVADAPDERAPILGPAPPPSVVAQLVEAVMAVERRRRPFRPHTPAQWEALYQRCAPDDLPWHREEADADLLAAVASHADGEILDVLEVGTGMGQVARALAAEGHRVVATDVSATALDAARAHPSNVVWLEDDVTDSHLRADFDVVLDRGCLHVLPPARADEWAAAVRRLTRSGGILVLKAHAAHGSGTVPYPARELTELVGDTFELVSDEASSFPGPRGAPDARLIVLRRR